jgi:hypothetical protein
MDRAYDGSSACAKEGGAAVSACCFQQQQDPAKEDGTNERRIDESTMSRSKPTCDCLRMLIVNEDDRSIVSIAKFPPHWVTPSAFNGNQKGCGGENDVVSFPSFVFVPATQAQCLSSTHNSSARQ